ncbi:MAG: 30S ribosomal protein S17 [Candidatus Hodgkinia cicadicola]
MLTGHVIRIINSLTLLISVTRLRKNLKYGKYVKARKTYFVHAKHGLVPAGSVVKFRACAPLSTLTKWSSEKF